MEFAQSHLATADRPAAVGRAPVQLSADFACHFVAQQRGLLLKQSVNMMDEFLGENPAGGIMRRVKEHRLGLLLKGPGQFVRIKMIVGRA